MRHLCTCALTKRGQACWLPTASMHALSLLSFPQKAQVVHKFQLLSKQSSNEPSQENFMTIKKRKWYISSSYSQSKAQMNHPKKMSWLLVAVLNATCTLSCHGARLAEERGKKEKERKKERKKKERQKIRISDFRPFQRCCYYVLQTGAGSITCSMQVSISFLAMLSPCKH